MIDETAFAAYRGNNEYIVTVLADGREIEYLIKADTHTLAASRVLTNIEADDLDMISCRKI